MDPEEKVKEDVPVPPVTPENTAPAPPKIVEGG